MKTPLRLQLLALGFSIAFIRTTTARTWPEVWTDPAYSFATRRTRRRTQ